MEIYGQSLINTLYNPARNTPPPRFTLNQPRRNRHHYLHGERLQHYSGRCHWLKDQRFLRELEGDSVDTEILDEELRSIQDQEPKTCRGKILKVLDSNPFQILLCVLVLVDAGVVIAEILLDLHAIRTQLVETEHSMSLASQYLRASFRADFMAYPDVSSLDDVLYVLRTRYGENTTDAFSPSGAVRNGSHGNYTMHHPCVDICDQVNIVGGGDAGVYSSAGGTPTLQPHHSPGLRQRKMLQPDHSSPLHQRRSTLSVGNTRHHDGLLTRRAEANTVGKGGNKHLHHHQGKHGDDSNSTQSLPPLSSNDTGVNSSAGDNITGHNSDINNNMQILSSYLKSKREANNHQNNAQQQRNLPSYPEGQDHAVHNTASDNTGNAYYHPPQMLQDSHGRGNSGLGKKSHKYTHAEKLLKIAHVLHYCSIAILGLFVLQVIIKMYGMGLEFFRQKLEVFDAVIICASFALDLVFVNGIGGGEGEEAAALLIVFLLWRLLRVINGLMVTEKKRQEFRLKLQKRARRKAEKRVESLEDDKRRTEKELEAIRELCKHKGASDLEINNCKPRKLKSLFNKMDTSAGLSSIAALSLGFGMSMSSSRVIHSPALQRAPYRAPKPNYQHSNSSPGEIQLHNIMVGVGLLNDETSPTPSSTASKSPKITFLSVPKYKRRHSPNSSTKSSPRNSGNFTPKISECTIGGSEDGCGTMTLMSSSTLPSCHSSPNVATETPIPLARTSLGNSLENVKVCAGNGDITNSSKDSQRDETPNLPQLGSGGRKEGNSNQNNSVNNNNNTSDKNVIGYTGDNSGSKMSDNTISNNDHTKASVNVYSKHNAGSSIKERKRVEMSTCDEVEPLIAPEPEPVSPLPPITATNTVHIIGTLDNCDSVDAAHGSMQLSSDSSTDQQPQQQSVDSAAAVFLSNDSYGNLPTSCSRHSTPGKTEEKERLIHSSTSSNESTDSRGNPISEPCRAKRAHFASKSNPKQRHSARVTRQKPPLILKQTSSLDIELVKGSGMTAPAAGDFRQKLKSVSPTAAKKLCISNGKVNSKGPAVNVNTTHSPSDPELYVGQNKPALMHQVKDDLSV